MWSYIVLFDLKLINDSIVLLRKWTENYGIYILIYFDEACVVLKLIIN